MGSIILHFGRDRSLLSTRSLVLERTGVAVERCYQMSHVDRLLEQHARGLLVLCYSLSEEDRRVVVHKARQRPGFKILHMVRASTDWYCEVDGVDVMVSLLAGPAGLVKKAAELLLFAERALV